MGSLQDALRQAGLAESNKRSKKRPHQSRASKANAQPKSSPGPSSDEIDLAQAYRARHKAEQQQAEEKKKAKQAAQEARRQRNLALDKILEGQAQNHPEAEVPRFFEHLSRIRRVMCTPDQRDAVNGGQLAIVMFRGRALLVSPEVATEVSAIAPDVVPVLSSQEPSAANADDEGYPPIPDDLIW